MTPQHGDDTTRTLLTGALSWVGAGAAWLLDHTTPIAGLVSVAYTIWLWRRQVKRDRAEQAVALEELKRLSDEYGGRK